MENSNNSDDRFLVTRLDVNGHDDMMKSEDGPYVSFVDYDNLRQNFIELELKNNELHVGNEFQGDALWKILELFCGKAPVKCMSYTEIVKLITTGHLNLKNRAETAENTITEIMNKCKSL